MTDEKSGGLLGDLWDAITGRQDSDHGGSTSGNAGGPFDPPSSQHDSDKNEDNDW